MSYAIVIPAYKRFSDFNEHEKLSFLNNCHVFKNSIVIVVLPFGLKSEVGVFENQVEIKLNFVFFDDEFFRSIVGYNKLMTDSRFYLKFKSFDYIFVCQTDVWVFENKIEEFAKLNYSYIGGVHFKDSVNKDLWDFDYIDGNINGGASLRKVKDHIRVLNNKVPWMGWSAFREFLCKNRIYNPRLIFWYYRKKRTNVVIEAMANNTNEDLIFYELSKFIKWFKLPKVLDDKLLNFSWDVAPWVLYKKTNRLPMACHAWFRDDFPYSGNMQFWRDKIKVSQ